MNYWGQIQMEWCKTTTNESLCDECSNTLKTIGVVNSNESYSAQAKNWVTCFAVVPTKIKIGFHSWQSSWLGCATVISFCSRQNAKKLFSLQNQILFRKLKNIGFRWNRRWIKIAPTAKKIKFILEKWNRDESRILTETSWEVKKWVDENRLWVRIQLFVEAIHFMGE